MAKTNDILKEVRDLRTKIDKIYDHLGIDAKADTRKPSMPAHAAPTTATLVPE